jgi:hypothetical protein
LIWWQDGCTIEVRPRISVVQIQTVRLFLLPNYHFCPGRRLVAHDKAANNCYPLGNVSWHAFCYRSHGMLTASLYKDFTRIAPSICIQFR